MHSKNFSRKFQKYICYSLSYKKSFSFFKKYFIKKNSVKVYLGHASISLMNSCAIRP